MNKTILVKKIGEQSGFCKEIYREVGSKKIFVRQPNITGNLIWYTASKDYEPCCEVGSRTRIEIVK